MATATVSKSQQVGAEHFILWLRTANGEHDCEDCAAGGRFLGNTRDAYIVLLRVFSGRVSPWKGGAQLQCARDQF